MSTDYRALCAELLNALENAIGVIYGEDGTKHISTADAVITKADAALAQPEPEALRPDRYELGDAIRRSWLKRGQDSWCSIADDVLAELPGLSQPEPEGVGDEEIDEWQAHCAYLTRSADNGGAGTSDHYWAFDVESDHVASIVRAALAHWGRPSINPVPVSERPWEREGWCDAEGRCWWFNHAGIPEWQLASDGPYGDFSLPHHALPLPTPTL